MLRKINEQHTHNIQLQCLLCATPPAPPPPPPFPAHLITIPQLQLKKTEKREKCIEITHTQRVTAFKLLAYAAAVVAVIVVAAAAAFGRF